MPEPIHYIFVALLLGGLAYMGFVFLVSTVAPLVMFFTAKFPARTAAERARPKFYDYDEDR
jgi:hypothetical protein